MKTTLIITIALIIVALALLAGIARAFGKPGRPINVCFDQLKNMEHRDR